MRLTCPRSFTATKLETAHRILRTPGLQAPQPVEREVHRRFVLFSAITGNFSLVMARTAEGNKLRNAAPVENLDGVFAVVDLGGRASATPALMLVAIEHLPPDFCPEVRLQVLPVAVEPESFQGP